MQYQGANEIVSRLVGYEPELSIEWCQLNLSNECDIWFFASKTRIEVISKSFNSFYASASSHPLPLIGNPQEIPIDRKLPIPIPSSSK